MKTVSVKFDGNSRSYAYMTDIEGVEVGDVLVVHTPHSGYTCVTVTSVDETADTVEKATKWVVCKVDVAGYNDRIEREERRRLLLAKLKKMQAEVLEADQFKLLAKLNPDAAKLVKELKSIT